MTQNIREEILKEIDFLSDHWVKGDDRPPFSFGGWREEVGDKLVEIYQSHLNTTLKEIEEEVGKKKRRNCGCPPFESKHDGPCDYADHSELNQALDDIKQLIHQKLIK